MIEYYYIQQKFIFHIFTVLDNSKATNFDPMLIYQYGWIKVNPKVEPEISSASLEMLP